MSVDGSSGGRSAVDQDTKRRGKTEGKRPENGDELHCAIVYKGLNLPAIQEVKKKWYGCVETEMGLCRRIKSEQAGEGEEARNRFSFKVHSIYHGPIQTSSKECFGHATAIHLCSDRRPELPEV